MFTGGVDALAQPPSSCKVQAGDNPSEAAVIAVAGRSGSVFRRARNRRQARLQYGLPRVQKFSSPLQHAVACFLFRPRRSARQKSCAGASRLSASVTRGPRTTMSSPCWPAWGASASASLRRPSEAQRTLLLLAEEDGPAPTQVAPRYPYLGYRYGMN